MIRIRRQCWLLAGLWLWLAGCGPWRPASASSPTQIAVIDQTFLTVQETHPRGAPALSRERAIDVAQRYAHTNALPLDKATSVAARYVALTLRTSEGKTLEGVGARKVWLVTLSGVAYEPPGADAPGSCTCAEAYRRPSTAVA